MSIFDFLRGEFIDVIHWTDDTRDTIVWRFERAGPRDQVRRQAHRARGAGRGLHPRGPARRHLRARALRARDQQPADPDHAAALGPRLPGPFKSEIYFVNTRRFTDLKWGTRNPITCRDPEFGMVRLRAFGTYTMRVADPAKFMTEIVGTDGEFTTDEIEFQIRNVIVSNFSQIIATSGIPVLDMAANTIDLAKIVHERIAPRSPNTGWRCPPS